MLELNPEQRNAVEHGEGPLLVVAGPGSGKTSVITQRIVHLLQNVRDVQPENILALTFTEKAAGEMKSRVAEALVGCETGPFISTFHAFCYHILSQRHFERRLLDKVNVWIFLRQRMEHLGLEFYQRLTEPGAFLHDLNEFFSRCQDELIEPEDFQAYVERLEKDFRNGSDGLDPADRKLPEEEIKKQKELACVFRNSRRLIEDAGCSALGSLISETVRLWDSEPELLGRYRTRFRCVLVDEFQDTNYAQVELLRRLVAAPHNITAVGDDDQAIYRFRGAAHGAFEMFEAVFPAARKVYLYRNYRSTKKILRAADVVIARNERYERKPALETEKREGCAIYLLESPDYASEGAWIAGEVERLVAQGRTFGEIAVLYRGHSYRDLLVEEFRHKRIPFAIRGLSILSAAIIRDLIAYLNLVHSPHDNISLTRVLLAPHWNFPEDLALEIRKQASKDRCSLYVALEARERTLLKGDLENTGWPELKKLLRDLNKIAERFPVTALFDQMTDRLGLRFLPGDAEEAFVESFRKFLADWETKSDTKMLREFMGYFRYFREAGGQIQAPEPKDSSNAVQMMTVHAAKGLEFPVLFILSVARQRFPHREERPVIEFPEELRKGPKPPADIHLEEERRLFYVAMTRAQERLYISSVVRPGRKPSVFVEDLLSDPVVAARDIERIKVLDIPVGARRAPAAGPPYEPHSRSVARAPYRLHGLRPPEALERRRPSAAVVSGPTPTEGLRPTGGAQAAVPLLLSERAGGPMDQPRLFGDGAPATDTTHPDLAAWAGQPPTIAPGEKLRLSATAIEDYRDCPLKFKFGHYLKIPTGPQAPLTFGNIMHRCVRHYFELRKKTLPHIEDLEEFYLRAWRDVGFEDPYQEQAYKKAGLEQLRQFVEAQKESTVPAEKVRLEEHFQLDLGDIVLEGRIDQINPIGPLGRGGPRADHSIELVDYKTGRPRTQKDADKSLQLSVYALAARKVLKLDPARLTFYNLTNNQPVSTVRTEKDLDVAVEQIRDVAEKIRRMLFDPAPGFVCKRCDFVPICPAHEKR